MSNPADVPPTEPNHPEALFRVGYVSASIFTRVVEIEGERRIFRSVALQKSFLDGDVRKWNSSFGLAELPQAIRCLQLAQIFIEAREARVSGGE